MKETSGNEKAKATGICGQESAVAFTYLWIEALNDRVKKEAS